MANNAPLSTKPQHYQILIIRYSFIVKAAFVSFVSMFVSMNVQYSLCGLEQRVSGRSLVRYTW